MFLRLTPKIPTGLCLATRAALSSSAVRPPLMTHLLSKSLRSAFAPSTSKFSFARFSTDVALRDLLQEEIKAEQAEAKKTLGDKFVIPDVAGFVAEPNGADVVLSKTYKNEKIKVYFNVNNCVRQTDDVNVSTDGQEQDEPPVTIIAEPPFRVEIEKASQKLVFDCEFNNEYTGEPSDQDTQQQESEEQTMDMFNITDVYIVKNGEEVTDQIYGASGDIIDGNLYDHLWEYLAERGINNKFGDELLHFATYYEHSQYVRLLTRLQDFVSTN